MNGFIKKSIGSLTLGEKLKKLRSERRISLGEVSRYTRIQVKYLEYLEEGRYDKLPVDVYIKGFLKNYADFLAVDPALLIRLYEKEKEIRKNMEKSKGEKKEVPKPLKISYFILTPKLIVVAIIIIMTFGGFFYIYKEIGAFASVPRLVILSPEKNSQIQGNSVMIEGVTDKDVKLYINEQPILVNDDGKFQENLTLQSGNNFINIKAVNRFDKEISETLTIQSGIQEESGDNYSKTDVAESVKKSGIEIELKIDPGPVWVNVESDGNLKFSGTMLTGSIQKFKADEKITISSGRANATFLKFNGKDVGALGDSEEPIRGVTLTSDTTY